MFCAPNLVQGVQGGLVTDPSAIPDPKLVVNFSQFKEAFPPPPAPVQIGDLVSRNITMEGSANYGDISYSLGYMSWTPQNGYWRGPQYSQLDFYFTTYTGSGAMTFHFRDPVKAVGALVNYDPHESPHPTITALDKNGQALESYDLAALAPISTPSQENQGGFRGIVRPQADIYGFRYGNGNLVLTNLTFTDSPRQKARALPAINSLLLD